MIFVVFALLLGINMLTWIRARINFQFIFGELFNYLGLRLLMYLALVELEVGTAIDAKVYFEVSLINVHKSCFLN